MTAAELRARADALEAEEHEARVMERASSLGIRWDSHTGEAYEEFLERVPCPGGPYGPHERSYTDEYGSRQYCTTCRGSGTVTATHKFRRPNYDAPRPEAA